MDKRAWPAGIRPSGRGLQIRIFRNRQVIYQETIACDPYSERARRAAAKRRQQLLTRLELGLPLYDGDESGSLTVEQACQQYLNTLDAKRSTITTYRNILNHYWMPHIGHWPLQEISSAKLKEVLASMAVSGKTRKNVMIPLRGALDHVGMNPNPAAGIRIKRGQKAPVERYTPHQRDLLLVAMSGQAKAYFAILFGCGLRPGEALGLRWSDYDGEELDVSRQVTQRRLQNYTKTNTRRRVYVPSWVRPLLNEHPTRFAGEFVFVNERGGHYRDTDAFNAAWKEAHKRKRIPYRIPYTCRHTRAAELLSIGIEPADAAKQMGHSPEMFLRTYAEYIEEFSKGKDKSRFEGVSPTVGKLLANLPAEK